jgi:hypothetical protein
LIHINIAIHPEEGRTVVLRFMTYPDARDSVLRQETKARLDRLLC